MREWAFSLHQQLWTISRIFQTPVRNASPSVTVILTSFHNLHQKLWRRILLWFLCYLLIGLLQNLCKRCIFNHLLRLPKYSKHETETACRMNDGLMRYEYMLYEYKVISLNTVKRQRKEYNWSINFTICEGLYGQAFSTLPLRTVQSWDNWGSWHGSFWFEICMSSDVYNIPKMGKTMR